MQSPTRSMTLQEKMFALVLAFLVVAVQASTTCRCFPGDACWPSENVWAKFNQTIDGQLVKTVPLGSPCHVPNYDAAECNTLRDAWIVPEGQ
jgi:hypothetical protein